MSVFSVLCVEDNEANMLVVQRILESKAWNLIRAVCAEEAFDLARKYRPDLVLMDMNLPGMNGLDATRYFKQDMDLAHIPIIAVTASSHFDRPSCLAAGCEDFVQKPITMSKLLVVLHKWGVHV